MANQDNTCKDLEIEDLYSKSPNTLNDLYMLQKDIQENVYNYNLSKIKLKAKLV